MERPSELREDLTPVDRVYAKEKCIKPHSEFSSVEAIFTDTALSDGNSPVTPSQPK